MTNCVNEEHYINWHLHVVSTSNKDVNEMVKWCKENVSPHDYVDTGLRHILAVIYFRYPEDLIAFKMKFG